MSRFRTFMLEDRWGLGGRGERGSGVHSHIRPEAKLSTTRRICNSNRHREVVILVTLASLTQIFGGCSVWRLESLAKNFTSARFRLAMSGAPSGGPGNVPPGKKGEEDGFSASEFAGVGLQFAVSIIVFLYLGQWLDR